MPIIVLLSAIVLAPTGADAGHTQRPSGTHLTTITEADLPPDYPPEIIPQTTGQWELEFTETGELLVRKAGAIVVEAHYISNPARLVITDLRCSFSCIQQHAGVATGIYQWAFEDNELTLAVIHDDCLGRPEVLTAHPLQK